MDGASDQPRLVKRGAASRMKQFTTHTLRRLASGIRLAAAPSKDTLIGSDDNDNDNECVAHSSICSPLKSLTFPRAASAS
jgi:hypothetical protein